MFSNKRYFAAIAFILLSCSYETSQSSKNIDPTKHKQIGVLSENIITFTKWSGSTSYTKEMVTEDFKDWITADSFVVEHPENLSVDSEGNLTFKMPAGKIWLDGSGAQIILPIKPANHYTVEYSIFFDGDSAPYHWTSGGKLPGVAGGKGYTGGDPATQGDGFSARLMFGYTQGVWAYVYHEDMPGKYGDALGISKSRVFKLNAWNTVRLDYNMNTGEIKNGSLKVFVNDMLVGENNTIRYRTNDCPIDKLLLVFFHGGATDDYRPDHTQYIKMKWIKLSLDNI